MDTIHKLAVALKCSTADLIGEPECRLPIPRGTAVLLARAELPNPLTLAFANAHPDMLFTVAEVAEVFRVVPETVLRWIRAKRLAAREPAVSPKDWLVYGAEVQRAWGAAVLTDAPRGSPDDPGGFGSDCP